MKIGDLVKAQSFGLICAEIIGETGRDYLIRPVAGYRSFTWTKARKLPGVFQFAKHIVKLTANPKLDEIFNYIRRELELA